MRLATNQIEFSLLRRSPETSGLLAACAELGVLPLAYSPIGQGRLTGKYSASNPPPGKRNFSNHPMEVVDGVVAELRRIGEKYGGRLPEPGGSELGHGQGGRPDPRGQEPAARPRRTPARSVGASTRTTSPGSTGPPCPGIRSLQSRFWQHG